MTATSADPAAWRTQPARIAALSRSRDDGDPDLARARQELKASRLADYIKRTVDAAPPLSAEQRERLVVLLRGGGQLVS